nr:hypothetical protein [uncultured bacterium]AOE12794.1 hypothetical protein [uncultured bacterium]
MFKNPKWGVSLKNFSNKIACLLAPKITVFLIFPLKYPRYFFSKKNIPYLKNAIINETDIIYFTIIIGSISNLRFRPEYANTSKIKNRICLTSKLKTLELYENL